MSLQFSNDSLPQFILTTDASIVREGIRCMLLPDRGASAIAELLLLSQHRRR